MAENVAALLYLSGDEITAKVLMSKAINGRVLELAGVVVSLCVVCWRHAEPTSWVVAVLRRVLVAMDNARDRLALLRALVDTFRDNVADLHDFAADAADDDPRTSSLSLSLSLSLFSARCNIYISRLCYDVSVRLSVRTSVCLSVMEVHWRIIANWAHSVGP